MNAQRIEASADRLAESVWFRLAARGSMIALGPALTVLIWLGGQWLDYRFQDQVHSVVQETSEKLQSEIDGFQGVTQKISDRVLTLENNTQRGREDRERFQEQTTLMLQELIRLQNATNLEVAALKAQFAAQQRQIDNSPRR